jgi:N-acetylmuramoyl-L-alanine amidase
VAASRRPSTSSRAFLASAVLLGSLAWAGAVPATAAPRAATAPRRPAVVWKPIPFGPKRRRQTAAYSKRHYGAWRWRLTAPKVIVEHFTGGTSFSAAWNTFASDAPHLGELPGTCAHFVIDRDGTIYQLVRLGTRCRHTMGLNAVSFGIEHVGTSDADVLSRPAQMRSSFRLTLWLMSTFHVRLRDVIGHAESLMSPYHHELVDRFRCQTHGDWTHADMRRYRGHLRTMAKAAGVPIGPAARWVDPDC